MTCLREPFDWIAVAWLFGWPIFALVRFELRLRQGRYDPRDRDGPS